MAPAAFPLPCCPKLGTVPTPTHSQILCHICELGFVSMPGFLPNTIQILKAHCYPQERLETHVSILLGGKSQLLLGLQRRSLFRKGTPEISCLPCPECGLMVSQG